MTQPPQNTGGPTSAPTPAAPAPMPPAPTSPTPSASGPTGERAPERALRPAIWLALVTLATVLLAVLGWVAGTVLAGVYTGEDFSLQALVNGETFALWLVIGMLVVLAAMLVGLALKVASIVLGILVTLRGSGKLRVGAILLVVAALWDMLFSLTVEGSFDGTAGQVLSAISTGIEVLRWGVLAAGLVLLVLGIRQLRAGRGTRV